MELLLLQAPARSDPVTPLPRHLGEKKPGQVPGATYTAQCNGVKGFPSRYANGLCSSNNSRQSSCPVRREGHKCISAQPVMEQEGTEGPSSSPHDQREAPGTREVPGTNAANPATGSTGARDRSAQALPCSSMGSSSVSSLAAKLLLLGRFLTPRLLLKPHCRLPLEALRHPLTLLHQSPQGEGRVIL